MVCVVCISGCGGCGKSTFTVNLFHHYNGWRHVINGPPLSTPHTVRRIHADEFYLPPDRVPSIHLNGHTYDHNWDSPDAMDWEKLEDHVRVVVEEMKEEERERKRERERGESKEEERGEGVVLVEGFNLLYSKYLSAIATLRIVVDASRDDLVQRNYARDPAFFNANTSYFDDVLWPSHVSYVSYIHREYVITHVTPPSPSSPSSSSVSSLFSASSDVSVGPMTSSCPIHPVTHVVSSSLLSAEAMVWVCCGLIDPMWT